MASGDDVATLDAASLDAFRTELVESGFEPSGGTPRRWKGPIADPLRCLTPAESMTVVFQDGWPHRPPKLLVDGIVSEHAVTDGEVCLYQPADSSMTWSTWTGFQSRIAEWATQQREGFRIEDAMLDAHLYFTSRNPNLAVLDLATLGIDEDGDEAGRTGDLFGQWDDNGKVLRLYPSRPEGGDPMGGRWYYHGKLLAAPPHDLGTFQEALTRGQRTNLGRRLDNITRGQGPMVFAMLWETRYGGRNGLVLLISERSGRAHAEALELAPADTETLRLRAGRDAETLLDKAVVIFGVGSLGSNIACRLAEAGLGRLKLVDGDRLRPGNVVRHAGHPSGVGYEKTVVTAIQIRASAPWTTAEGVSESPWSPVRLRELVGVADLVIEATGLATFAELLARVAADEGVPLISAALYRGGSVGRVRRQVPGLDRPLPERTDEDLYPIIPPGEEPPVLEAGCSAPVNNASPIAAASIAATAAAVCVDTLTERLEHGEELIDVYRPLDGDPFDRVGRIRG